MDNIIVSNIDKLKELFEKNKIQRAFVFGPAVSNDLSESSDIDFLVRFQPHLDPLKKGELGWNLHDSLRDLLKREIDLVTENSKIWGIIINHLPVLKEDVKNYLES